MTDSELIEHLGGPAKVCDLLGYEKEGGVQRVHNWILRGIPAKVKVERPDLFMVGFGVKAPTDTKAAA
jgi:hypothetical protein